VTSPTIHSPTSSASRPSASQTTPTLMRLAPLSVGSMRECMFARILGLRREWFQPGTHTPGERGKLWHYDVTEHKRQQAIRLGATPIAWRDIPSLIRGRAALADRADHTAGLAWRSGDLGRAERLIQLAKQLDPARTALWDKRLHAIEHTAQRAQKPSESVHIGRKQQASPGPLPQQSQLPLAEEIAARLIAAGIKPTDPAITAIRQWNAAAFRRAHQAASEPEAAGS
jgi:hypothetical protein